LCVHILCAYLRYAVFDALLYLLSVTGENHREPCANEIAIAVAVAEEGTAAVSSSSAAKLL